METAYDIMEKINEYDDYIKALGEGYDAISNWDEEFGEGNPDANVLKHLRDNFMKEREELVEKLKGIRLK